jgi:hypothetical protein
MASDLNYKRWDLNNTTAADFTVEIVLTKEHWKNWLEKKEELQHQDKNSTL